MKNSELERLKKEWRGKYRGQQTTWQYLEEIRGPVRAGLSHSELGQGKMHKKSHTVAKGEYND